MKVLFAVGTDQLSKNIADKYYEKFGEVLEYKNVFFYKALLEEVKKNKTYDRIIINEMFEEIRATDLEQIDRFVFNNIDKITDEIQDTEIILICADWRKSGDSFINKLFSIGIYNMLIGDDRSMNPLCEIIKRPRTKREAKQYLNIDTSLITNSSMTKDNEVDEYQVKSILNFYEGIKNQPEKYLETFDRVAEQYSKAQLKVIVEYLPKAIKDEIFKADRYKYLAPQVDVPQIGVNAPNVSNKIEPPKKKGFFASFRKSKEKNENKTGTIDIGQMTSAGKVDLSSNAEEQEKQAEIKKKELEEKNKKEQVALEAKARAEEEARRQAELAAKAKAEAEARRQAELEAKAKAEAEARRQEELAAKAKAEVEARKKLEEEARLREEAAAKEQEMLAEKARAEALAREQAELEAKAKAEEKKKQLELEAKARAEAAAREQAMLAEKAKKEALAREEAIKAEKEKATVNAKEQAELAAKAKAEAMARQQAMLAEKAKAEANARMNAGLVSSMKGGAEIPNGNGNLVEVKPNPNAPDRKANTSGVQAPKVNVPNITVNVQAPKVDVPNVTVNMQTEKKTPANPVTNPMVNPAPVVPNINPVVPKAEVSIENNVKRVENTVQPEIKVTTNSGVAPVRPTVEQKTTVESRPVVEQPVKPAQSQVTNISNNTLMAEQEKRMKEDQEKLAAEQKMVKEMQAKLEEEKRKLREEQEKFVLAQKQLKNDFANTTPQYSNNTLPVQTSPVANYKKMVVFVGANKVGTTFVVNAVAHSVASAKITTSILDMTRDKSLYYIYADESKALKNRASECMQRLAEGEDYYIETMNSHLKLYTSLAGSLSDQRRGYKHRNIIDTIKKNCNLTIVDADFTTPIDYFDQADEIYLVQDLDVLKIQDVTLFLRELNARGLDKKKIKLIINKFVKTSITPKIIIGALDFYHDPAGTYVDSGLMPSKVDYSIIPYNLNNYAKYVESLHKMSGNFNYKSYSTDFNQAIDEIVAKVYPKNLNTKKRFFG